MPGSLDPQYHREPGSKWPGFLVNRSGLPIDDQTWSQVSITPCVPCPVYDGVLARSGSLPPTCTQGPGRRCRPSPGSRSCKRSPTPVPRPSTSPRGAGPPRSGASRLSDLRTRSSHASDPRVPGEVAELLVSADLQPHRHPAV